MFSLSWLRGRGIIRARPSTDRRRTGRAIALSCLAAVALAQTGCRSGGGLFSPCGFVGRTTSRIMQPFRHGSAVGGCCGTEIGSEVPIEYAAPVGVVAPAAPLGVPVSPSSPSSVDTPERLEALPRSETGPAPTRGGRGSVDSSVRKPSSYDSQRPAGGSVRGDNLAHTVASAPARPSPETIRTSNQNTAADDSVLDHLPPLDLPAEVTGQGDSPPIAPAAVKPRAAASASAPVPSVSSANDHFDGRSAREAEAAPAASAASLAPSPDLSAAEGDAIGIARFASVDLKLAGGSLPSTVGLGWLVEKGYKTVLDLRDSSQTSAAFIGEAASRGLRYIALPASLDTLSREQLDRFSFELSINDARPLYFFDEDGRRAGGLWYLRRVLTEKASADVARREAEELGLIDSASWKVVYELVDRRLGPKPEASKVENAPAPAAPTPKPASAATNLQPPSPLQQAVASRSPEAVVESGRIARASIVAEPGAWQPFAAMVLTGLTFPLAYFSRTVVPTMLARTRASLPGPARRPKSLPPSSDA